jgi:hypothetical protein
MAYYNRPSIAELRQWVFEDGMTGRAIAKKYGFLSHNVNRWLREAGLIKRVDGMIAVPLREVTNGLIVGNRYGKLYFIDYAALDWLDVHGTIVWLNERMVQLEDLCDTHLVNILDDAGEIARTVRVRSDVVRVGEAYHIEIVQYCFDPEGKIWYLVFQRGIHEPKLSPRTGGQGKVWMTKAAAKRKGLI